MSKVANPIADAHRKRNEQIRRLLPSLTHEQIARRFGITRQRVQQIASTLKANGK